MAKKSETKPPPWFDHPQYRAFEADIIAHPDDDTPRLVLADWLEDHGDEPTAARAEFLRVQLELARLADHEPRRGDLKRRQDDLLAKHEASWLGPLQAVAKGGEWRRGFLHRLRLGVRQFMENAEQLFRLAPILHLQLLRVSQTKIPMSELAACPYFGQLRGFTLSGSGVGDDKLAVFLAEANLENLEALELPGAGLGLRSINALVGAKLPNLRALDLSNNYLHRCFEMLYYPKASFKLRELDFSATNPDAHDREALFAWPGLATVEKLNLSYNHLGTAGGAELAACPHLGALRELNLTMCEIGARGIRAIAEAGALPDLRELNLTNNSIPPSGVEPFLNCRFVDGLRAVRLGYNRIGNAGLARLAAWSGLARHARLELSCNGFGPGALEALCTSPHLGELTELSLSQNQILDRGAFALARCEKLARLENLDVALCQISDAGADALLESPHLRNLCELSMIGNALTKDGVRRVIARFPEGKVHL